MKKQSVEMFRCPVDGGQVHLIESAEVSGDDIVKGVLVNRAGRKYEISDGLVDFTVIIDKEKNDYALTLFKEKALEYDKYQHLSFETFYQNERDVRNSIIDKLFIQDNHKILEVNAGTGRDSVLIHNRLAENGVLHIQDISPDMLAVCRGKFISKNKNVEFHRGNACRLPYDAGTFDGVYSFGGVGMNTYAENRDALMEMTRVCKSGGRIVFGGLSLAPWLRNTSFGKILANHNTHYLNIIRLEDIPIAARNVSLEWILEGAGFVMSFIVGEGEPRANFDYEIPGPRGGTLRTRFTGQLEGVSPEAKDLAQRARAKLGVSMHQWIDKLIKCEAEKILKD